MLRGCAHRIRLHPAIITASLRDESVLTCEVLAPLRLVGGRLESLECPVGGGFLGLAPEPGPSMLS